MDQRAADPAVMRLAIAQVNPTVGNLAGNRQLVEEAAAKAERAVRKAFQIGAAKVNAPELFLDRIAV